MQLDETVNLSVAPKALRDPFPYILESARSKRVLNVGASGGVEHYLPERREGWLHHRLQKVAAEVVGIDIDSGSVAYAAEHGVKLIVADCEVCEFSERFDLIVMSDVIEHVNSPMLAIGNLAKHLAPGGRLLITTPNATHYGLVLRAWIGRGTGVYYDHVCAFLPEHFQVICRRLGLQLAETIFFSHMDARSLGNRMKSRVARCLGSFMPRCHSSLLVVIQRESPR